MLLGGRNMNDCIGVIGAMDAEVKDLISKLEGHSIKTLGGIEFHTGRLFSKNVVIARCGVGKVFAAMCAQAMIIGFSPRLIVNTGVAGALAEGLDTGDTVIASRLVQHDMDTSTLGDPKGLISGINKIYFDADERAVKILCEEAERLGIKTIAATVASGDVFVADKLSRERIKETFDASACEMEGASIAQVAFVNSTPFAVIRAISDNADGNSAMSFPTFLAAAAKTSQRLTEAIITLY